MESCDTFVVLPDVSRENTVIFGKNSDRPIGEVQEVIFLTREEPHKEKLQVGKKSFLFSKVCILNKFSYLVHLH